MFRTTGYQSPMNENIAKLSCPKCKAPMRTYERNGIVIDQCTGCHGIFLDRGELERLIGIESSYLGQGDQATRGPLGKMFD